MSKPLISIIMPFRNAGPFIEEAISSMLKQTQPNFELILINDASTDNSHELIQQFLSDSRVIYIQNQQRQGIVVNLNTGIDRAQADIIARMDGDDVSHPDRLRQQFEFLAQHPDIALVGSFVQLIDEHGQALSLLTKPLTHEEIRKVCFFYGPFVHPSIMYRKQAVVEVGKYRAEYELTEDIDLFFRLIFGGYRTANLPKVLLNYRQHGNSTASHSKEIGRKSYRLKKETVRHFHLKLSFKEWASIYAHYLLDMTLTGDQKRQLQLHIKQLVRI